jgi:beta-phosphoglucomutase
MKKIDAFIFDLDGVITDTAEYHYLAWKALADELHISFDQEFNEKLKGISRIESLEIILEYGNQQQNYTFEQKEQLADKKNEHYKQLIHHITEDDLLPGIKPLIEKLKREGITLGLASASKNAFTVMEALGLKNMFDYIVDAGKITNGKPDPEIFLTAAKQLHADPKYCIGIEDAASGVTAIKSAGMFAVGVGDPHVLVEADIIVQTTSQLDFNSIVQAYREKS